MTTDNRIGYYASLKEDGFGEKDIYHPLSAQHGIKSYRVLDAMVRSANMGKMIDLK